MVKGFLDPVAWGWGGCLLVGCWALWAKHRRVGLLLLLVVAMSSLAERFKVAARLLASREAAYVRSEAEVARLVEEVEVDAVVMLGGVLMPAPELVGAQYMDSVDRVITGVGLSRQLGVPLVMGGGVAGVEGSDREPTYTMRWLDQWGLGGMEIEDLGEVRNTRDEAVSAAQIIGRRKWERVCLVTSAWHLRRAEGAFERVGVVVVPFGADFRGTSALEYGSGGWLPRADSMLMARMFLTEMVGEWYYRSRGWIR